MTRRRRNATAFALGAAAGFSLMTAACQDADRPAARESDTAESLAADPDRLDAVQAGCRTGEPWAREQLCQAAAEARRARFQGEGVTYTPRPVDPFPGRPEPAPTRAN